MISKFGLLKIKEAAGEVADFHHGTEEIGSSDVSIYVKQTFDILREFDPNMICPNCKNNPDKKCWWKGWHK